MALSERILRKMSVTANNSDNYSLCFHADSRLHRSLQDKGFIIVNDIFLVKMYGLTAALALREDTERNIEPGYWYVLRGSRNRRKLRTAFILGRSHVTLKKPNVWVKVDKINSDAFVLGGQHSLVIAQAVEGFSNKTMMRGIINRFRYVKRGRESFRPTGF